MVSNLDRAIFQLHVESWPLGLRIRPGDVGAQEEFDLLLSSSSGGVEQ
jgi:hypothetical protein